MWVGEGVEGVRACARASSHAHLLRGVAQVAPTATTSSTSHPHSHAHTNHPPTHPPPPRSSPRGRAGSPEPPPAGGGTQPLAPPSGAECRQPPRSRACHRFPVSAGGGQVGWGGVRWGGRMARGRSVGSTRGRVGGCGGLARGRWGGATHLEQLAEGLLLDGVRQPLLENCEDELAAWDNGDGGRERAGGGVGVGAPNCKQVSGMQARAAAPSRRAHAPPLPPSISLANAISNLRQRVRTRWIISPREVAAGPPAVARAQGGSGWGRAWRVGVNAHFPACAHAPTVA